MHTTFAPFVITILSLGFAAAAAQGQLPRPPAEKSAPAPRVFAIPFASLNIDRHNSIAFSSDGSLLAFRHQSDIVIWDIETRNVVTRMHLRNKQESITLAFAEDGKTLVSTGCRDPMIRFWDVKSGKQFRERLEKRYAFFNSSPVRAFGPGARMYAVLTENGAFYVDIVDTKSGEPRQRLEGVADTAAIDWALSSDGKLYASGDHVTFRVWNTETGALVRTVAAKNQIRDFGTYAPIRFSHDGKYLCVANNAPNAGYVSIWDVADGLELSRFPFQGDTMEMSPDGRLFVAGSGDCFDLWADNKIDSIQFKETFPHQVQCSPDGKTLAFYCVSRDGKATGTIQMVPFPFLGDDTAPTGRLSAADEADLWTGLCSPNLSRRRYVTTIFKAHADQAVTLLQGKIKPVPEADRKRILDLIDKLDDDDFERREAAMKDLQSEAFRFEPLLRETVKNCEAGERRNRLTHVLKAAAEQPVPAGLVVDQHIIELLEALATPAARTLLEQLAAGAAGARTTVQASQALKTQNRAK